jgi:hypothetical protein
MPKKTAKKTAKKSTKNPAAAENVVVVPKPAKGSYNPKRPLAKNTLLQNQVDHFRRLEKNLPAAEQTGHDPQKIRTEGEAAEYLRKMTALLHPQGKKSTRVSKAKGR